MAEGDELDGLAGAVDDWSTPTPAPGWTVAHQIAHLAWADANVLGALRSPDAIDPFRARRTTVVIRPRSRFEAGPRSCGSCGSCGSCRWRRCALRTGAPGHSGVMRNSNSGRSHGTAGGFASAVPVRTAPTRW
ncbi:maleylpyruvate isomerase N-terminal domain-containing protein [Streptomyces collinus]|uniref:maleylpyruvate isomerase N-terminal domain-containing protein n=1 Tax=Streptomyces collinus TaxID=42684 RepID=UPI0036E71A76